MMLKFKPLIVITPAAVLEVWWEGETTAEQIAVNPDSIEYMLTTRGRLQIRANSRRTERVGASS